MADPVFGISITRVAEETRPAVFGDLSVVGLIGVAANANPDVFPVNEPVFMFSDDVAKLAALGDVGTLPDAVRLLHAQLGEFQVAAKVVIVRVAGAGNEAATVAEIAGNGTTTGVAAFLRAGPALGFTPRLLAAPGYTSQREDGIAGLTIANPGSGYTNGTHALTATGGSGTGFAGTATVVGGLITDVQITNPGTGYTAAPTVVLTALGAGTGGSVIASYGGLANPVCVALEALCPRLLAHAVVDGPGTTLAAALDWRETMNSERLIPVDPAVRVMDGAIAVNQPLSPAVLGIAVRRDHEFNGRPFHSWANQPVRGIVGPSRPIGFSMTDGASEGQAMLAANIGILTRGEMGVDGALASGGFVFVGTDNVGEDDVWRFYSQTRGRDYIHLMFLRTLRFYLGKFNISGNTIEAIKRTMDFALRDLQATGDILGYKVEFFRDDNSPEQLRQGRVKISFKAEEAPVLRHLALSSGRYRSALDTLLDDLIAQVST